MSGGGGGGVGGVFDLLRSAAAAEIAKSFGVWDLPPLEAAARSAAPTAAAAPQAAAAAAGWPEAGALPLAGDPQPAALRGPPSLMAGLAPPRALLATLSAGVPEAMAQIVPQAGQGSGSGAGGAVLRGALVAPSDAQAAPVGPLVAEATPGAVRAVVARPVAGPVPDVAGATARVDMGAPVAGGAVAAGPREAAAERPPAAPVAEGAVPAGVMRPAGGANTAPMPVASPPAVAEPMVAAEPKGAAGQGGLGQRGALGLAAPVAGVSPDGAQGGQTVEGGAAARAGVPVAAMPPSVSGASVPAVPAIALPEGAVTAGSGAVVVPAAAMAEGLAAQGGAVVAGRPVLPDGGARAAGQVARADVAQAPDQTAPDLTAPERAAAGTDAPRGGPAPARGDTRELAPVAMLTAGELPALRSATGAERGMAAPQALTAALAVALAEAQGGGGFPLTTGAQGAAASLVIFNAAMIPQWPPALRLDQAVTDQAVRAAGADLAGMNPEEAAEYLAKMAAAFGFLLTVKKRLAKTVQEEKDLLLGLFSFLGVAFDTLTRGLQMAFDLTAEQRELLEELVLRDETGRRPPRGGRGRERLKL